MNAFEFAWICLSVLVGYLAWRGSHSFWRSVFAGLAIPLIGLIVFGSQIGRGTLEAMSPVWIFAGLLLTVGVLIYVCRR